MFYNVQTPKSRLFWLMMLYTICIGTTIKTLLGPNLNLICIDVYENIFGVMMMTYDYIWLT